MTVTAPPPVAAPPQMPARSKPSTPAARPPRAAAPQQTAAPPASSPLRSTKTFAVRRGAIAEAHKVVIYGPGGVGKTELCSLLTQLNIEPLFVDLEGSSSFLDVARLDPAPETFEEVRDAAGVVFAGRLVEVSLGDTATLQVES